MTKIKLLIFLSVTFFIFIIIGYLLPDFRTSSPTPTPLVVKINDALRKTNGMLYSFIEEKKRTPSNSNEFLKYIIKSNYSDMSFFYDDNNSITKRLGSKISLKELKTKPNSTSMVIKKLYNDIPNEYIKKGDKISILYYTRNERNKVIYSLYAVDGINRFLELGGHIMFLDGEIDLTQSNAR